MSRGKILPNLLEIISGYINTSTGCYQRKADNLQQNITGIVPLFSDKCTLLFLFHSAF